MAHVNVHWLITHCGDELGRIGHWLALKQTHVPSSTVPSQLSSIMLPQISWVGIPGVQLFGEPPTHAGTVFWHAPVPQLMLPSPSSTMPLQLSSTPLHIS